MGVIQDRDQRRLRQRLRRQFLKEASSERVTLVSSEHLTGLLREARDICNMADFLSDIFDSCQVIMFIRRGDHWLPSAYAEAVSGGLQREFDAQFVRSRRHLLDHMALLRRWVAAFGASSVDLLPYLETDKRDPQRIPIRFLEHLGFAWAELSESASVILNTNRRMSPTIESTEVLRRVTSHIRHDVLRPSRQRNVLRDSVSYRFPGGTPLRLTRSAHRALEKWGWIDTGIGKTANAKGTLWSGWSAQDSAEVSESPLINEEEIGGAVATMLSTHSAGNRVSSSSAAWLRRAVIRAFRR